MHMDSLLMTIINIFVTRDGYFLVRFDMLSTFFSKIKNFQIISVSFVMSQRVEAHKFNFQDYARLQVSLFGQKNFRFLVGE